MLIEMTEKKEMTRVNIKENHEQICIGMLGVVTDLLAFLY